MFTLVHKLWGRVARKLRKPTLPMGTSGPELSISGSIADSSVVTGWLGYTAPYRKHSRCYVRSAMIERQGSGYAITLYAREVVNDGSIYPAIAAEEWLQFRTSGVWSNK